MFPHARAGHLAGLDDGVSAAWSVDAQAEAQWLDHVEATLRRQGSGAPGGPTGPRPDTAARPVGSDDLSAATIPGGAR